MNEKKEKRYIKIKRKLGKVDKAIDSLPVDDKMKEEVATYIYRYLNERMSALK